MIGRSLRKIAELCNNINDIQYFTARDVKKKLKYAVLPQSETWSIGLINDMRSILNMKGENIDDLSYDKMTAFLEHGIAPSPPKKNKLALTLPRIGLGVHPES